MVSQWDVPGVSGRWVSSVTELLRDQFPHATMADHYFGAATLLTYLTNQGWKAPEDLTTGGSNDS